MLRRLATSSFITFVVTVVVAPVIARAEASSTSSEIAHACNSGRNGNVTVAPATVDGQQGEFYFYRGIGHQTAGPEQCTTYFIWLERNQHTVTMP